MISILRNKYSVYFFVLITLCIFDILFLLKFEHSFFASTFNLLFMILTPGFLLARLVRLRFNNFASYLCYSIGLSTFYLIAGGLFYNTVSQLFGVVHPLARAPLIISTNFSIIVLTILSYLREEKGLTALTLRLPNFYEAVTALVALAVPVSSIAGAINLNNHGFNHLAIASVLLSVVCATWLAIFSKRVSVSYFALAIYCNSLGILLALSMRSNYVIGSDITSEFKMFQQTLLNQVWYANSIKHAYNACLSITMLPAILAVMTNINPSIIFKLVIQILFASLPVTVFLITLNKLKNNFYSYLGAILFIAFPVFINTLAMHIRQEIAFVFFALIIHLVVDNELRFSTRKTLLIAYSVALVLSHYSTAYILLLIFIPSYTLFSIKNIILNKIHSTQHKRETLIISFKYLLVLTLTTIFWYSQVNTYSANIFSYGASTLKNLNKIFSKDYKKDYTSLGDQFSLTPKAINHQKAFSKFLVNYEIIHKNNSSYYSLKAFENDSLTLVNVSVTPLRVSPSTYQKINLIFELVKKLVKAATVIGLVCWFIVSIRKKHVSYYFFMSTISLLITLLFLLLPNLSVDYDLLRAYQQILVILTFPTLIGLDIFVFFVHFKTLKKYLVFFIVIMYMLIYTQTFAVILGGYSASVQLNNSGDAYDRFYIHQSEFSSTQWLIKYRENKVPLYADAYALAKINTITNNLVYSIREIVPGNILKNSYLYLAYPNKTDNLTYSYIINDFYAFTYPIKFANQNKNEIYNNKFTSIYY